MKIELQELQCLRKKQGVYFLYNENKELVYIGESGNMYQRIMEHIIEGKKKFSFFKAVQFKNLLTSQFAEVYLISVLKPIYNKLVVKDFKPFFQLIPTACKKDLYMDQFSILTSSIIKVNGQFQSCEYNSVYKTEDDLLLAILEDI